MFSVQNLSRPGLGPLSFEVAAGGCLGIGGPSGAGKSLLLRAIADLDPNDGRASLDGESREAMPAPGLAPPGGLSGGRGRLVGRHGSASTSGLAGGAALVDALGLLGGLRRLASRAPFHRRAPAPGLARRCCRSPRCCCSTSRHRASTPRPSAGRGADRGAPERRRRVLWVDPRRRPGRRVARRCAGVENGQVREAAHDLHRPRRSRTSPWRRCWW